MTPFTGDALGEIKLRSHGKSELSGRTDRPLHCMHFNHDKSREEYNTANEGLRVTIVEHLAYHVYFRDNPQGLGLIQCRNDFAIDVLNRNCIAFLESVGQLDQFDDELADSVLMWEQVLTVKSSS